MGTGAAGAGGAIVRLSQVRQSYLRQLWPDLFAWQLEENGFVSQLMKEMLQQTFCHSIAPVSAFF